MVIGFFLMAVLFGLGVALSSPSLFMTITFQNYQVYLSIFTFAGFVIAVMWLWALILLPFKWLVRFATWRKNTKEAQKQAYLSQVLEALVNHNKEQYPLLVKQAYSHFTTEDIQYWLVLALLQPTDEVYQKLLSFPTTVLGGIHGFLKTAEGMGNTTEMRNLLEALPEKEKKVLWVKQAYLQLALMEADWTNALTYLDNLKKTLSKSEYRRMRACLLMMMGEVDQAYKLDDTQAPIILAKAKENPEKALKILKKAWEKTPCQEIYVAYKKALAGKTDEEKMKAVVALVKPDKGNRFSILALADMNLEIGNAPKTKEILEGYLENFPLTEQVALMMARCEREGWHHEEAAQKWERKALNLQEKSGWVCTHCGHTCSTWEPVCSACHLFNSIIPN